jgi:alcohol dehydrogenase
MSPGVDDKPGRWTHWNPVRVTAGFGALARLPDLVPAPLPVLLVTTAGFTRRGVTARVTRLLGEARVIVHDHATPNAQLDDVEAASAAMRGKGIGVIVGLGGGSVLDAAKALALGLRSAEARPFSEVFLRGRPQAWSDAVPLIAIPTTAGTGSEVTPFATVWDRSAHKKHSLSGDRLFPAAALLDPELTLSLPAEETLYSALDAISHALESLWNRNRTPVSSALAIRALAIAHAALPRVLTEPDDVGARAEMQQASLLSGLTISQTRTAMAHSVSYPLTSRCSVPHGLACSFTLPHLLRMNLDHVAHHPHEHVVLAGVLELLDRLDLSGKLRQHVSAQEVLSLQAEMHAEGRIENFDGHLPGGLRSLLEQSVQ